ncbi:cytochrome P450 [Streptomyces noursei]|uniref:cytochrome P450 n=1 Tax=Streptomyces noursei TaxID=1971 RepID=UPI003824CAF5
MTTTPPLTGTQPMARTCPFDPPDEYRTLREQAPISQVTLFDGRPGWLITGFEDVRAVLADPRFSANSDWVGRGEPSEPDPGIFLAMDPPEHTRLRRLLTGMFTVRRMRQLAPRVEEFVAERLDAMARAESPVDLVQEFALPIPSLVICELLGVPYADREEFQQNSATMLRITESHEVRMKARAAIRQHLHRLVLAKRAEPTDDILSELVQSGELTDEELVGVGSMLLVAGHETTANMIAMSTLCLLRNPEQLAALRADPTLMDGAVEELLRYLSVVSFTRPRLAREDVELGGQLIKAGSLVTVAVASGNRDEAAVPGDPDQVDVARGFGSHLAFGHGIHQCLGQQLARVEIKAALRAMFDRFPTLRLAVPLEDIPMRNDMIVYGVHKLPVTW